MDGDWARLADDADDGSQEYARYRQKGRSTTRAITSMATRTTNAVVTSNSTTDSSALHGSYSRKTITPVTAAPPTAHTRTT